MLSQSSLTAPVLSISLVETEASLRVQDACPIMLK
jgi:hypothetical protein